ncbi:hypothetical protein NXV57_27280 [Bacteroides thetaiotaomicron]|nr:hypothetical protein [Bacteroides thetaiotaomicron]
MGKQQTAGQIKGEWHSRRKEVVSMWPKPPKADRICLSPLPSPFLDFTQSRSLRVTMRNPETGTVTPLKGWVGNM